MKLKKLLIFLPLIAVSSCGYSLSYLVEGNKYNSPIYKENYYKYWDPTYKNAKKGVEKTLGEDEFITSFNDLYKYDARMITKPDMYDEIDYAKEYKMNNIDKQFNYGYQSKLFDGQIVCGGYFQLSRIQIDENGFSGSFEKESSELSYFALQFKSTTDSKLPCLRMDESGPENVRVHNNPAAGDGESSLYHNSVIDLTISLYTKNAANELVRNSYTASIENKDTNNGSHYIFFAFDLKNENLSRMVGFSITYTVDDELINHNKGVPGVPESLDYALFLYEMFLPYTSWN